MFKLYDQKTSGTALWKEQQTLTTSNGIVTAQLGTNTSLSSLTFDQTYYLGITVDGGSELTPRTRLTTVPYAMRAHMVDDSALTVDKLDQSGASPGEVLKWNGNTWEPEVDSIATSTSGGWALTGNSGTTPGTDFLGTTDQAALVFKVNDQQAARIVPEDTTASWNIGNPSNIIASGVDGAVVAGGSSGDINKVINSWAVVLGGRSNIASGLNSSIVGGTNNKSSGKDTFVGGGNLNEATSFASTISGGTENQAQGKTSFIGGGNANNAQGWWSTISGGNYNTAKGFVAYVGGGDHNHADGNYSAIPGGEKNAARGANSFAIGQLAKANDDHSFVWSDGSTDSMYTTGAQQFLINASGGVGIGTNKPDAPLTVASQNHWDLANNEGDFKIGNDQYRLKIGLATGGGGAGSVNIWADGGTGKLSLGSNGNNVVSIQQSDGMYPATDNKYSLGTSNNRWSAVYAANGAIQTSDRRLKKDINSLQYGLDDVMKLKPVSYEWKKSSGLNNGKDEQHLGLIAQDVDKVISEVVERPEGKNGYLGMSYTGLVPVLIKAIQEQQKQMEEQKEQIQKLKNELKTQQPVNSDELTKLKKQVKRLAVKLNKLSESQSDQQELAKN